MTLSGALAVYFVIWWTVLFAVLPFGVHSQSEAGPVADGTDPGAPQVPALMRKAVITTIAAAIIFAVVWYIWTYMEL